jgi:hypothetical protein
MSHILPEEQGLPSEELEKKDSMLKSLHWKSLPMNLLLKNLLAEKPEYYLPALLSL